MNELSIMPLGRLIGICLAGFLFSILSTLAGIGGGAIFIPLYILIGNLDVKPAIFLALITMVGNSISRVIYYAYKRHYDSSKRFLSDFHIIRLFVPYNSNAVYLGFVLNQVLPGWAILILIILLMITVIGMTTNKLVKFWRENKTNKNQTEDGTEIIEIPQEIPQQEPNSQNSTDPTTSTTGQTWWDLLDDLIYICLAIGLVTFVSYYRQSSSQPWVIYGCQFVLMLLFGYLTSQHIRVIHRYRKLTGFHEVPGDIDWQKWTVHIKLAVISSVTGICSALLGIGGGLIMNPTMLHLQVPPKVMLAVSGWTTFFSVTLSTIQYLVEKPHSLEWYHGIFFSIGFVASCVGLYILKFFKNNAKVIITAILDMTMILCAILLIVINVVQLVNPSLI